MIEVTRRFEFSAAHHLTNHDGPCRRQHGHNFVVEVTCRGPLIEDGPQEGMVVEFGDLQRLWEDHLEPQLDHRDLNDTLRGLGGQPTTERVADWLLNEFLRYGVPVYSVRVWETPKNSAIVTLESYYPDAQDGMAVGAPAQHDHRTALEAIATGDVDGVAACRRIARRALGLER